MVAREGSALGATPYPGPPIKEVYINPQSETRTNLFSAMVIHFTYVLHLVPDLGQLYTELVQGGKVVL